MHGASIKKMSRIDVSKKLEPLKSDSNILAIMLFGSYARGEQFSDIDVCLVLNKPLSNLEMSKMRVKYQSLLGDAFDVQIYQQLPLYIRVRVLREGIVVYCRDEDKLYELAYRTIKDFVYFEKYYRYHLEAVLNEHR
ncbi:MAG: nucleotidyltransferase domain-containing protein [Candidatus Asgardarchaeia archaeon]